MIFFTGYILIEDEQYIYYKENGGSYKSIKLVIPKIGVDKFIYDMDSEFNNVDYNIELLDSSAINNNVYYFASHSGNGDNCYFNRVKELEKEDVIYVFIGDRKLIYEVVLRYFVVKNGYMEVDEDIDNVLFLITCSGHNRQLIVKAELIN